MKRSPLNWLQHIQKCCYTDNVTSQSHLFTDVLAADSKQICDDAMCSFYEANRLGCHRSSASTSQRWKTLVRSFR